MSRSQNSLPGWIIVGALVALIPLVVLIGIHRGATKRASPKDVVSRPPAVVQQSQEQVTRSREAREQELLERVRSMEEMAQAKAKKEKLNEDLKALREEYALVTPGRSIEDVRRQVREGAQRLRDGASGR